MDPDSQSVPDPDPVAGRRSRSIVWLAASFAVAVVLVVTAMILLDGDDESATPAGPTSSAQQTAPASVPAVDGSTVTSTSDAGGSGTTVESRPSPTAAVDPAPTTAAERDETAASGATTSPATVEVPVATSDEEVVPQTWTVTSVVTGDTIDVVGPGGSWEVRLLGVVAPSDGACFAEEAVDMLRSLVEGPLVLVEEGPDEDNSGRKLRYVETTDGVDVGAEMILQGAAFADPTSTAIARWQGYAQRQVQAENEEVGMWASGRCGPGEEPG